MAELPMFRDIVIVLATAVVLVAVLHRFRIPSIAAAVLAGALVGPNALGLVSDPHGVETLAEVGVVLLLFSIGTDVAVLNRFPPRELPRDRTAGA